MLIELTRGKSTELDSCDADLVSWKWCVVNNKKGYQSYATHNINGKQIRMHRIILERILDRSLGYGEECDHIDGDGLNNKRSNLRLVDHRRNMRNTHNRRNATMSGRRHKQLTLWDYLIRMSRAQTSKSTGIKFVPPFP